MSRRGLIAIGMGIALLIPLLIFVVLPVASGSIRFLTVLSGSMSPAIKPGDMAVINEVDPSELGVGDIIAYRSTNEEGNVISHRIVEVIDEGELSFRTKGDANEEPDQYTVGASDVVGKVTFTIPYAGYLFYYAGKPIGFFLLIFVPAVLLIVFEIRNIVKERKGGSSPTVLKGGSHLAHGGSVGANKERRKEMGKIAVLLMFIFILSSFTPLVKHTDAHFSDVEVSRNNTFTAWVWREADDLVVDTSCAKISLCGRILYNIDLKNEGLENITIDEIKVGWTPDEGEEILGIIIHDGNFSIWVDLHGEPSGAIVDIQDYTLPPGSEHKILFGFDSDMSEKDFSIEFTMNDRSTENVVIPSDEIDQMEICENTLCWVKLYDLR